MPNTIDYGPYGPGPAYQGRYERPRPPSWYANPYLGPNKLGQWGPQVDAAPDIPPPFRMADDAGYMLSKEQLASQLAQTLADIKASRGEQKAWANTQTKRLKNDRGESVDQSRIDFAQRGGFYSGARKEATGDIRADYGRSMQDVATSLASTLAALARQQAGAYSTYNTGLEGARQDAEARMYENVPAGFMSGDRGDYQDYARSLLGQYGWDAGQFDPLNSLVMRESGWNPAADNPTSSAYGIPQAMMSVHFPDQGNRYQQFMSDPYFQVRWMLSYIQNRYGSPANAWGHSQRTGWY